MLPVYNTTNNQTLAGTNQVFNADNILKLKTFGKSVIEGMSTIISKELPPIIKDSGKGLTKIIKSSKLAAPEAAKGVFGYFGDILLKNTPQIVQDAASGISKLYKKNEDTSKKPSTSDSSETFRGNLSNVSDNTKNTPYNQFSGDFQVDLGRIEKNTDMLPNISVQISNLDSNSKNIFSALSDISGKIRNNTAKPETFSQKEKEEIYRNKSLDAMEELKDSISGLRYAVSSFSEKSSEANAPQGSILDNFLNFPDLSLDVDKPNKNKSNKTTSKTTAIDTSKPKPKTKVGKALDAGKNIVEKVKPSKVLSMGSKALAVGGGLVQGAIGVKNIYDVVSNDELSDKDKSELISASAGSTAGGIAGGALGAAIGSIVPGIGTAIGYAIGSWLGSEGGEFLGKHFGKSFGDMFYDEKSSENYKKTIEEATSPKDQEDNKYKLDLSSAFNNDEVLDSLNLMSENIESISSGNNKPDNSSEISNKHQENINRLEEMGFTGDMQKYITAPVPIPEKGFNSPLEREEYKLEELKRSYILNANQSPDSMVRRELEAELRSTQNNINTMRNNNASLEIPKPNSALPDAAIQTSKKSDIISETNTAMRSYPTNGIKLDDKKTSDNVVNAPVTNNNITNNYITNNNQGRERGSSIIPLPASIANGNGFGMATR